MTDGRKKEKKREGKNKLLAKLETLCEFMYKRLRTSRLEHNMHLFKCIEKNFKVYD